MEENLPEGFARLDRGGPFLASLGSLYAKKTEQGLVIAMRIEDRHLNTRVIAHGGMLVTLADSALGIAIATAGQDPSRPRAFVTVNLSVDFIASAREGDFVEAHVGIEKLGARLAFATCFLQVGTRRVLRASGVFATVTPARPKERFEG
ncbi:MAG TPA: PaaI family thioesterase [Myxococcales bacterium]|nr:PaaI family thioesterase [Myxococcales bacterium]